MTPFRFKAGSFPLLVSMPHPGTALTEEARTSLSERAQKLEDTDWHIPKLYDFLADFDVNIIEAQYSRYVVDLNRPPDNQALYSGPTTGLFSETFFDGEPLYRLGKMPSDAIKEERLNGIWKPYHNKIRETLDAIKEKHGYALLWDAHSIRGEIPFLFEGLLPDLNLANNSGKSSAASLVDSLLDVAKRHPQYSHVLNGRFKGGYITRHYGEPDKNIHAIQLELAQRIYMDEATFEYNEKLSQELQIILREFIETMIFWGKENY